MTSLKDSWKEIGEDILDTKRRLTSKQDELKLELIKIRGIKEFQGAPEEIEEKIDLCKNLLIFTNLSATLLQKQTWILNYKKPKKHWPARTVN